MKTYLMILKAMMLLVMAAGSVQAATIFSENFNGYSGTTNNTQSDTGLPVATGGNVPGWSKSGAGAVHAVNLGSGNMAIMFYQDNVITLTVGIAANANGGTYKVDFDYGTAVYAAAVQETAAGDGLLVEVLRADNSVLASGTYTNGVWSNPANVNLSAGLHGTLQYVGDGSGPVKLRIGPTPPLTSGRFEGEIDNLTVSVVSSPFDRTFWTISMPITFTNDARLNTHTNFTALVVLDPSKVNYSQFQANAQDLRFADTNGIELAYEVESWNTTSNSYIWVNIPTLTAGCVITAYWGNASVSMPAYRTNGLAWDSTFNAVWHLGEVGNTNAGGYRDSTVNTNNGTGTNMTSGTEVASMISTGQQMNGSSREIDASDSTSLQPAKVTMSAWINATAINTSTHTHLLIKPASSGSTSYGLWIAPTTPKLYFETAGGNLTGGTTLSTGQWYHVAATYDGSNMRVYLNGVQDNTTPKTGAISYGAYQFRMGHGPWNQWFNGIMDEVRISSVARSTNWIWACYMNMASNSTFNTYGAVSVGGGSAIQNLAPTAFTNNSAVFNGQLACPTTNYSVYVHWGTADGTNNFSGWAASAYVGAWTNVASTNFSFTNASLLGSTTYYYTFRGTNASTNVWASPSWQFTTPPASVNNNFTLFLFF